MKKVNLKDKFGRFSDQWSPKIVAELNGQHVKVAKVQGEFVWHDHADEDELFWIIKGTLLIDFRDRETVELNPGELYVVPRGVQHNPRTKDGMEVWLVLIEPTETKHTGDVVADKTVGTYDYL